MHYDVIVAGLGAMGSAAAYQLAARGARVLGLDRFSVPNTHSSHHGHSRVIRTAYFEHADYVPLLRRAYELWRELELQSGERLLTITGGLYMGAADSATVAGSLSAARLHNLPHQQLDAVQIAARFPQFRLPTDIAGMYEPDAGVLYPERCVTAHARLATQHGAELHEAEPLVAWEASDKGVIVRTATATYSANRLLLTCGAWSNALLGDTAPLRIVPTRQAVGWLSAGDAAAFAPERFPVWLLEGSAGVFYGLPALEGRGPKLACHDLGPAVDPHSAERQATEEETRPLREFANSHLPGTEVGEIDTCLYENSPDGHFIVDFHPQSPNLVLACGFSGHGFKFASVMGEALADKVLNSGTELPVGFLSLARFR